MNRIVALSLVFAWSFLGLGCGDDDTSDPTDASTDTGGDSGDEDGAIPEDGGGDDDGGVTRPTDPLTQVPPVQLEADPATDCPAAFRTATPEEGQNEGFESGGQDRSFFLILPEGDPEGPVPVFIAFNGTGETGRSFSARAQLTDFAARGFLVIAPDSNANGTLWPVWDALRQEGDDDPNLDVAYVDELLQCMAGHFDIDSKRIYAGGHSAGGIMSNRYLRERSDLLAGGVVASGVFSLTDPETDADLDDMIVLVTWGGDNDEYSGGASGVSVPVINFSQEAALASAYYESQPNVAQANCSEDLGHAWLANLNDWMVDLLLAYPKGLANGRQPVLDPVPSGSGATCTADAAPAPPRTEVECPESSVETCNQFCQLTADCAVTNPTVGPILEPQLSEIGFGGVSNLDCSGCVDRCEGYDAPADGDVLDCLAEEGMDADCSMGGVAGVTPWIRAVTTCCTDRGDSPFCVDICEIILTSSTAAPFFEFCGSL